METTDYQITYRTLENDPQYFGGYLNMARLNVYNISNHIAQQFEQASLNEDGRIKDSFLCNKEINKLNWNHVFSKTVKFLPIIKVFDSESLPKSEKEKFRGTPNIGKDFNQMSDSLKIIFGELQDFRNDYSHYYSVSNGSTRKTKISKELAHFLNINFSRAIEYTKERFLGILKAEDFNLVASKKLVEADYTITTEGLVFLISIFLEKEHANLFMSKIKGLRGTQYAPFIATREVLTVFCIKLPHERFVSEDPQQAFLLDLINTLNRCPK